MSINKKRKKMNLVEKCQVDINFLEENYLKEIKEYEKILNKKVFYKIINKIKEKYEVILDEFCDDNTKMLGNTKIISNNINKKIYFKLFDFYSTNGKYDMFEYLKGKKYNLDIEWVNELVNFKEFEKIHLVFVEVKKIIDEVIGDIK